MDIVKNINIKGSFDRFDESRFFSSILGFSDSATILGENLEQQQLKAIHEFQPLQQPTFRQCGQTLQQSMSSLCPPLGEPNINKNSKGKDEKRLGVKDRAQKAFFLEMERKK